MADIKTLTAEVVASYVGKHSVSLADLPDLIQSTYTVLNGVGQPPAAEEAEPTKKLTPAKARKSITDDGITSFIDGKVYKSMRRHLSAHGFTPQSYREKFGLPDDYPIVAASYSAARSAMARRIGLGAIGRGKAAVAAPAPKATRKPRAPKAIDPASDTFT